MFFFMAMIAVFIPVEAMAGPPRSSSDNPWTLCARTAAEIEIREDLPPHLLSAISKVESGRWLASEGTVRAWPWTVTAGGKGQFFATREEAIDAVRALLAKGRRNIDVGCMQVNLYHHPNAFEDVPAAFDPTRNIAYAAGLLQRLRSEARSWPKAVAFYHSRTASLNGPYRRKVFRVWLEEWRRAGSIVESPTAGAEAAALAGDDLGAPASDLSPTGPSPTLAGFEADEREAAPALGQVQLGAFRMPENARSVWLKLLAENTALLGDLQPRIDVVDRGKSGPLHFLRISPIMDVKLARSICNELLDRAVDCLVVKPPLRFALHGAIQQFR